MKKLFLSFCIPVYNEEDLILKNLKKIIKNLDELVGKNNYEILFAENGSTDKTIDVLKHVKNKNVRYFTIGKKGHGLAMKSLVENAKGENILLSAIDLPFGFSDLKNMLPLSSKFNIIFGSKKHRDSKLHYPLRRKISSKIYMTLLKFLFRVNIRDTQGSIFIHKESVRKFIDLCDSDNAFFCSQIAIYSIKNNLSVCEVPIEMDKKSLRKSKYKIIEDGSKMFKSMVREYVRSQFFFQRSK